MSRKLPDWLQKLINQLEHPLDRKHREDKADCLADLAYVQGLQADPKMHEKSVEEVLDLIKQHKRSRILETMHKVLSKKNELTVDMDVTELLLRCEGGITGFMENMSPLWH